MLGFRLKFRLVTGYSISVNGKKLQEATIGFVQLRSRPLVAKSLFNLSNYVHHSIFRIAGVSLF